MLEYIVFTTGAVVMIFELVGARILGPYVGTSTYAWTSIIGVVLASLSAGYYFGGRLADKRPYPEPLLYSVVFAAIAIAYCALFKDAIALPLSVVGMPVEMKSVLMSFVLFAPASFFLGMVSPYAVRLKMSVVEKAGSTSGNLYALSTAGSIFGTFLAGFYIIPQFGSTHTLFALSLVLAVVSLPLYVLRPYRFFATIHLLYGILFVSVWVGWMGMVQLTHAFLVADRDTEYNRIWVYNAEDPRTEKPMLALATDPYGTQAGMFSDGDPELVFSYTKFYRLYEHFVPHPKDALMIGGCAYTYPRDFLRTAPQAYLDVVEIDPGMTKVAEDFFGLTPMERLRIIHEDGRVYLNQVTKKYDVIFGDAFNSASSVPFQLTTVEAVRRQYESVREGGIVMVNIISALEGEKSAFAKAEYATYKAVFPQVFLFAVQGAGMKRDLNQNIMLVAVKSDAKMSLSSDDEEMQDYLSRLTTIEEGDARVLTDDFAPVEYYKRMSL